MLTEQALFANNLLPLIALWPVFGGVIAYLCREPLVRWWCLFIALVNALGVIWMSWLYAVAEQPVTHTLGGWVPPLGIVLVIDGLSLLILWLSAAVLLGVTLYSFSYLNDNAHFWPVLLFAVGGLNALVCSGDLFNAYIAIEILTFAAVGLAGWGPGTASKSSALRYLITSATGSVCYILGVALLYLQYATLDMASLFGLLENNLTTWLAFSIISVGLMMKSALFPFHFWLPSTHASAISPSSALLSSLIVKAPIYLMIRFWMELSALPQFNVWLVLFSLLGAAAILWGGYQALLSEKIKTLIAYSTISQVGYIFVVISLLQHRSDMLALSALYFFILSHGLAKCALFLAAGSIVKAAGRDDLQGITGAATHMPLTIGAIALAGVSLIGLPPSGGFVGKWMLLSDAIAQERWWLVVVVFIGTLAAGAYVYRMISLAFNREQEIATAECWKKVPLLMQVTPLVLALMSILIGFFTAPILQVLLQDYP